jgi:hypothetical protein
MGNMGYCRFENTEDDLLDCFNAIREKNIESEEERETAKEMLKDMVSFLIDEGIISDEAGRGTDDKIDELIDSCGDEEDD